MQKYKRIVRKNEQEINPILPANARLTDRVDRACVLRTAGQGAVGVNPEFLFRWVRMCHRSTDHLFLEAFFLPNQKFFR